MSGKECFQTSIREYDTIRPYLRFMYLYGCCTKKYMTDKGLTSSARKFEEDTRRTRAIIPDRIDETLVSRRKSLHVNVSALDTDENFLAASYFIRAFGKYDFILYFFVFLILSETPGIGFTELAEKVNKLVVQDEIISDQTIRRFLSEMAAEGLIVHDKGYSLPLDPFSCLSDDEIIDIITAVDFYRNILMMGVFGEYNYNTLMHYAGFSRKNKLPQVSPFIFRYRHLERIVDDDTLFPLIYCIRERRKAQYIYNGKQYEGFPRQIRYDAFYGRQYAIIHNNNRQFILQVTNMSKVSILPDNALDIPDEHSEQCSLLRHSWFAACTIDKGPVTVRAWFFINKDVHYILERLQREKRHGNLTAVEDNKYLLEIKLADPLEILPWLRSFLGYVAVEKSSEHDLSEQYSAYVSEMRKLYGV